MSWLINKIISRLFPYTCSNQFLIDSIKYEASNTHAYMIIHDTTLQTSEIDRVKSLIFKHNPRATVQIITFKDHEENVLVMNTGLIITLNVNISEKCRKHIRTNNSISEYFINVL